MPVYYVRKTGNNGNTGLSPAQAWLTIDHAANQVAAGDTVYIGAGIYREEVTMDTSGTSGNQISYIGDVTGEQTGDAGLVIISAHDDDQADAVRFSCVHFATNLTFVVWQGFVFLSSTWDTVYDDNNENKAYEGCEFLDCVFVAGPHTPTSGLDLNPRAGVTPATDGLKLLRCVFLGNARGFLAATLANTNAHVNLRWTIEDCLFLCRQKGVYIAQSGANFTYTVGGVEINNCHFVCCEYGVHTYNLKNNTDPVRVRNCIFDWCEYGVHGQYGVAGSVEEDYNIGYGINAFTLGNVTSGGNSDKSISGGAFGGAVDFPLLRFFGWSPYKPWEPFRLQDDSFVHGGIGRATAAALPPQDLYNNPRPMHGTTGDAGAVEGRARLEKETGTTYDGSPASARFEGAGYHDAIVPVSADLTTVKVQARYDGNYTGNLPILKVLNISGVANQSDVMVVAANTWEQLSCAFTPTSAGFVRVRLRSQDTSANGECFFDALEVS